MKMIGSERRNPSQLPLTEVLPYYEALLDIFINSSKSYQGSDLIPLLLGRDLIGVQNLQKKHQAMLAEIEGHEPRIKEVTQSGQDMINEGHFASDDIKNKLGGLNVSASLFICPRHVRCGRIIMPGKGCNVW